MGVIGGVDSPIVALGAYALYAVAALVPVLVAALVGYIVIRKGVADGIVDAWHRTGGLGGDPAARDAEKASAFDSWLCERFALRPGSGHPKGDRSDGRADKV